MFFRGKVVLWKVEIGAGCVRIDLFPEVRMAKKRRVARRKMRKAPAKRTAKRRTTKRAAQRKSRRAAKRTPRRAATRGTRKAATRRTKRAAKRATKRSKRKPSAAFMKPMQPDAALAAVVGDKPMPRTEITKKLWAYIKRRGLQDKKNRRMINADDNLRAVFNGKRQVSMFEMTKLVNRHLK